MVFELNTGLLLVILTIYSHTLVTVTVVDGVGVMVLIDDEVMVVYVVGVLVVTKLDKL